jgi:hypothetical protein
MLKAAGVKKWFDLTPPASNMSLMRPSARRLRLTGTFGCAAA